jgi:hypothetical protein
MLFQTPNTMKLRMHWPPVAGPNIGFKTINKVLTADDRITMNDIHAPTWWTGLRIVVQGGLEKEFIVDITTDRSADFPAEEKSWIQKSGGWVAFPWAIPAQMAKHICMGLSLRVLGEVPSDNTTWVKYELCFHEMGEVSAGECLLFIGGDCKPAMHWNAVHCGGGGLRAPIPLYRDHLHLVVPLMEILINTRSESSNQYATPHRWTDTVSI